MNPGLASGYWPHGQEKIREFVGKGFRLRGDVLGDEGCRVFRLFELELRF